MEFGLAAAVGQNRTTRNGRKRAGADANGNNPCAVENREEGVFPNVLNSCVIELLNRIGDLS